MFAGRFAPAAGAIGIDIGTRAVEMLQLRRRGDGVEVVGAARIDAPADAPGAGWAPTAEQWTAALRGGGFRGRRCIVCLPRGDVRIETARLPRMPEPALRDAAGWEAVHRFGLDHEHAQVDCLLTGAAVADDDDEPREEVILVAATHETIEARLRPLLAAGLRPLAVDTDFGGLASFFGAPDAPGAETPVRVVVEIGASGSSVLVLRGGDVAAYRPLSASGADLNAAVVERLQVDEPAAAGLRIGRLDPAPDGPALDDATDRAVYEAVRPRLMELVREVALCIRYHGASFRGCPPESIVLAGGDGGEPMLDKLLAEACGLPVHRDDRADTLAGLLPQIRGALNRTPGPATAWAGAAGLGLRAIAVRMCVAPAAGSALA